MGNVGSHLGIQRTCVGPSTYAKGPPSPSRVEVRLSLSRQVGHPRELCETRAPNGSRPEVPIFNRPRIYPHPASILPISLQTTPGRPDKGHASGTCRIFALRSVWLRFSETLLYLSEAQRYREGILQAALFSSRPGVRPCSVARAPSYDGDNSSQRMCGTKLRPIHTQMAETHLGAQPRSFARPLARGSAFPETSYRRSSSPQGLRLALHPGAPRPIREMVPGPQSRPFG